MNNEIQLVSPFPTRDLPWLWTLLNEFPLSNLDDSGPTDLPSLARQVYRREKEGETIWQVIQAGQPIGVIAYTSISTDLAAFHGIAFTRKQHGSGRPLAAVTMALEQIFAKGYLKVIAAHFVDNLAIYKFLKKLGFIDHHCDRHSVPRMGVMIDVRISALRVDTFREMHGLRVDSASPGEPQAVGGIER